MTTRVTEQLAIWKCERCGVTYEVLVRKVHYPSLLLPLKIGNSYVYDCPVCQEPTVGKVLEMACKESRDKRWRLG